MSQNIRSMDAKDREKEMRGEGSSSSNSEERKLGEGGEAPLHFRCPISMEVMREPVTISTGVTYERKNIERWVFGYNKRTCPATMQPIYPHHHNYYFTPNLTLKNLITSWGCAHDSPPVPDNNLQPHMVSLLNTVQSSPFKLSSLQKLRSLLQTSSSSAVSHFLSCNGVHILLLLLHRIDPSDFVTFRACEEALAVLHLLPPSAALHLLSKPDSMSSMALMLQRASADARLHAISIFAHLANTPYDWTFVHGPAAVSFFKSLLDLVSDDITGSASSRALEVLLDILTKSKKSRLGAIEAGAVCVLVEVLPDSNRSRCERILLLVKLLCECAEGRLGLVEHGLGIAAVSHKMMTVSELATKTVVKVLWLVCSFHPTARLLDEMLMCGAVKKLLSLLYLDMGRCSTKDKVINIFKLHAHYWTRYPCFPSHFKDYFPLFCLNPPSSS